MHIPARLCSRRMHPLLFIIIFALFFFHVVNSFLLHLIKACLRVMSCLNCDAHSSDFFNCEIKVASPSVASCNICFMCTAHVSQSESSSTSGCHSTRAHSHSPLPALFEVLSKSVQTHRTPGQEPPQHNKSPQTTRSLRPRLQSSPLVRGLTATAAPGFALHRSPKP